MRQSRSTASRIVRRQIGGDDAQPVRSLYCSARSVVDWSIAAFMLLAFAPLIGVLAMMVRIASPGPAFYSQTRLGRNGRTYRIYKLRTMTHNCEAATGPVWSCASDHRVTRLGRILRDTHLDELPQLWNVLRGEMSLVGPRPERPEIARRIEVTIPEFRRRLALKPGLTGLAQLRLPADTDIAGVPHKLSHDLYYMRNVGLLLDLRILVATAFHVLATGFGSISRLLLVTGVTTEQELPNIVQRNLEVEETEHVAFASAA